ncbi:AAA family ATPase [bacterium]|nr:AAA family ATPase [bacterium]
MECGSPMRQVESPPVIFSTDSERKQVTIMFSDLSEYTTMTERLDPEEVKEIMNLIFGELTKIIKSYDGFIEKFVGDSVMAVFGVPKAHEDDPIRAIRATIEMNNAIERLNPQFEERLGRKLSLHTGINTGLVVTGEVNIEKGTHGLTGDAINLASRLEGIAKPGEIIVGSDTYFQAVNLFNFKELEPTKVKGKQHPVNIFKVTSEKKESFKTHRLYGLQATLTGRDKEMTVLVEAVERLRQGKRSIISILGDAGTGKSRLKKELKDSIDKNEIEWHEGHAYSFTQNMPYYPLINLLSRAFQIDAGDPPEKLRSKVESSITYLLPEGGKYIPYIGSLFSLAYQELEDISPEYYKDKLRESIQAILSTFVEIRPTIVCFEDLHWADSSFVEFFELMLNNTYQKTLFICTYRQSFALFKDNIPKDLKGIYYKIHLKDLSPTDSQKMLRSLLDSNNIPKELNHFVKLKIEGNPFYLEEMVNSLIEFKLLRRDNGHWKLNRKITDADIPATIHGVLLARIDRLDKYCKRTLQEASAIGRAFHYRILKKITDVGNNIFQYLLELENLNLIKTQSIKPDLEYIFKHALTHEVVYDGLLKSERRVIHQRIGLAIEQLFNDRLPEFYETLAFHFNHSNDIRKAIYYLMISGKKSLRHYAVEESHRYYQEAFDLIKQLKNSDNNKNTRLVEILSDWFPVYYYRGHFGAAEKIMSAHLQQVQSIDDREMRGMFYIGYGMCLWAREKFREAYGYMHRALKTGQAVGSRRVEGYAHAWLAWVCFELGLPEETLAHGKAARALAKHFDSGHYPYYRSLDSDGFAYWVTGDSNRIMACSRAIFEYGKASSNSRVTTWGRFIMGLGQMTGGSFKTAIVSIREALKTSADPLYTMFPKLFLAIAIIADGDYVSIREPLEEIVDHGRLHGCEVISTPADLFLSVSHCIDGNMRKNISNINRIIRDWENNGARWRMICAELALGGFYLNLRLRETRLSFSAIFRNLPFLVTAVPLAARRALHHYRRAIALAEAMEAKGMQGQAYLGMARLYHRQGHHAKAMDATDRALALFELCDAEGFIRLAGDLKFKIEQT